MGYDHDTITPLNDKGSCEKAVKQIEMKTNYDLGSKTPAGQPLKISIEGDNLVIRIGVDTLAYCYEISDDNQRHDDQSGEFHQMYKVSDKYKFAQGVANALHDEEDNGSTPVIRILEEACVKAVEDCMGVDEDELTDANT
jgi:hypothetical protein